MADSNNRTTTSPQPSTTDNTSQPGTQHGLGPGVGKKR